MEKNERYELITRGLQEVIGAENLSSILEERDPVIYLGTAPTGNPHIGYFVFIFKIADFLKAGCRVKMLFADLHAYLDNMKSDWELLEHRTIYYEFLIKEMLKLIDVPIDKLEFVRGTSFQLSREYNLDMYKLSATSSTRDTTRAGSEVVKQVETPKLSSLLYPILQALDEVYLGADIQYGGEDQRKIFMFARENLPKLGYEKRIHLTSPLVPGLTESGKMSSSEPNSKIEFQDDDEVIRRKIKKAYSVDGVAEDNGLLAILKHILFYKFEKDGKNFVVDRPEKYGGRVEFSTYKEVEEAFLNKDLSSIDLKQALSEELIEFIRPLKEKLNENKELYEKAYPSK